MSLKTGDRLYKIMNYLKSSYYRSWHKLQQIEEIVNEHGFSEKVALEIAIKTNKTERK